MEPKPTKVSRSVRVTEDVDARIHAVCERLGVNYNAWLINAVGQQLVREESIIRIEQASQQTTEKVIQSLLSEVLPALLSEQTKDGSNESDD